MVILTQHIHMNINLTEPMHTGSVDFRIDHENWCKHVFLKRPKFTLKLFAMALVIAESVAIFDTANHR